MNEQLYARTYSGEIITVSDSDHVNDLPTLLFLLWGNGGRNGSFVNTLAFFTAFPILRGFVRLQQNK